MSNVTWWHCDHPNVQCPTSWGDILIRWHGDKRLKGSMSRFRPCVEWVVLVPINLLLCCKKIVIEYKRLQEYSYLSQTGLRLQKQDCPKNKRKGGAMMSNVQWCSKLKDSLTNFHQTHHLWLENLRKRLKIVFWGQTKFVKPSYAWGLCHLWSVESPLWSWACQVGKL